MGQRLAHTASALAACSGCARRRAWLRRQRGQPTGAVAQQTLWLLLTLLAVLITTSQAWAQPVAGPAPLPQVDEATQAPATPAAAAPTDENIETIAPDTQRELLVKFQAQYPQAREHRLNLPMNAYANTSEAPGLILRRMWVGDGATLLEIGALPVAWQKASAVIRQDTLELLGDRGQRTTVQAVEGVTQLKDRRGGSALVVKPGETLLALFGAVNYALPMRLQHTPRAGQTFVYFDNIDPRFRERYEAAYRAAAGSNATPEAMRDFLVEFGQNDPDRKARKVFLKLITAMRAQNTFGYYNVYLLLQDPEDARKASLMARTDEHRAKLEHMAVATLADKNRLIEFEFRLDGIRASGGEDNGGGYFGELARFFTGKSKVRRAGTSITGTLRARLLPGRPIPLALGDYVFTFAINATAPRSGAARELVFSKTPTEYVNTGQTVSLRLNARTASAQEKVDAGYLEVAYLDRGMLGGYTARWLTGDGRVDVKLLGVELAK